MSYIYKVFGTTAGYSLIVYIMNELPGRLESTPVRIDGPLDLNEMGLTATPDSRQLVQLDEEAQEAGYDSDGNLGPFYDQVYGEDDVGMYAEDEIVVGEDNNGEATNTPTDDPNTVDYNSTTFTV